MREVMHRALLILLLLAGLGATAPRARAFTLVGELPAWFTDNAGLIPPADVYGPVNLGEEYRWAVPNIVYAFDESFLNYFGQRGVEEVEKAIKIINDLPRMSAVNLSDYPTHSQRVNYRARDLGMYDLKSNTLKLLMEQLGLGTPSRFVFTLRGRDTSIPNTTNYLVIQRNFDPETWTPTPYINGQLWTYGRIYDNQDSPTVKASTIPTPVDPLIQAEPVASTTPSFAFSAFGIGSYITGLTRDDVGGLRYIYRPENRNVEVLPADATGTAGSGSGSSGGGGGGTIDEWIPLGPIDVPTDPAAGGGATGGGAVITTNGVFYPQAIRQGVDKITFVRGPALYQPGGFGFTNRFTETIVALTTNNTQRTVNQRVTRTLTVPDIVFTAADLADVDTSSAPWDRTDIATSNDAINGQGTLDGPGQFAGTLQIIFNKVGPTLLNTAPSFLGQVNGFAGDVVWGAFDGTTNDPVVFPLGSSIRDVERIVFGGR